MLIGQPCGLEAETHAVDAPVTIQKQLLISLDLDQTHAADVGQSENPAQFSPAELNGVKAFADPLEVLLKLASGIECG